MASDLVTLGAALVSGALGAAAAIGAGAVAQRGESTRAANRAAEETAAERARWERDQRAALYMRAVVVQGRNLLSHADMRETDPGSPDAREVLQSAKAVKVELMDVLMELQVIGSKDVHDKADAVAREVSKAGDIDQATLDPKWTQLLDAIRAELGIAD